MPEGNAMGFRGSIIANATLEGAVEIARAEIAEAPVAGDATGEITGEVSIAEANIAGDANIAAIETATFNAPAPILRWETYSGEFDDEGDQVAFSEAAAVIEIENLSETNLIALDTSPDPLTPPSIPTPPSTPGAWTQESNSVPAFATLRLEGTIGSLAFCAPAGTTVAVRVRAGFTTEAQ